MEFTEESMSSEINPSCLYQHPHLLGCARTVSIDGSNYESMPQIQSLPPEVEVGNVEYKLKLVDPTPSRIEHLVTQMKWRLKEGEGEAIYEIGVEDNGIISGLPHEELESSLDTLRQMADKLEAEIVILREHTIEYVDQCRYAVEVLVKLIPDNQEFIDIRVACLGNVDVGKSTLLSVLSYGDLDDGRGRARLNMFRHLHEIQSGRTSAISQEILGFNSQGEVLNSSESTIEEICQEASKVITFLDLAGHQKYLKTTIFGLTGYHPQVVMLVIAANKGLVGTTKEHLGLAVALKIPFLIVINKIDTCSKETTEKSVSQLEKILRSSACKKIPIVVNDDCDVKTAAGNFSANQSTPIFKVSSVTGTNLTLLRNFFKELPSVQTKHEIDELTQQPSEFQIDELFAVQNVGTVLAGTVRHGIIKEGDELLAGPDDDGKFFPVVVSSLHRNKTNCRIIQAGQTACVALKQDPGEEEPLEFRRGQILLEPCVVEPTTCMEFEADVLLLFHHTKISRKFQCTVHIGNVVQTAIIKSISKEPLSTGQRAKVVFKFVCHPEYIHVGDQILFREGRSKGIGEVTSIIPYFHGENKRTNNSFSSSSDSDT